VETECNPAKCAPMSVMQNLADNISVKASVGTNKRVGSHQP